VGAVQIDQIQVVQATTEAVYGTIPALAATDAHICFDVEVGQQSELISKRVRSNLAAPMRAGVVGERSQTLALSQHIRGYGGGAMDANTKYPAYHAFLQACGFVASWNAGTWTYKPADRYSSSPSLGAHVYMHDTRYQIPGARGNAVITVVPGQPAVIAYNFMGLASDPTDQSGAIPAPDYDTGTTGYIDMAPPICNGVTLAFDPYGDAPAADEGGHIESVTIDLRNIVSMGKSSTIGSYGVGAVRILARGSGDDNGAICTIEVEAPDPASAGGVVGFWDRYYAQEIDYTAADLSLVVGTGAGNVTTIQLGGVYIRSMTPTVLDGGRRGYTVELGILRTATATTEDDIVITCV